MYLRKKFIAGFLVLVTMLIVAAIWSIIELQATGSSVQNILDENYKSIHGARTMLEAVERQDSGLLLIISGSPSKGEIIIQEASPLFEEGFDLVANNITIEGEYEYIEALRTSYKDFSEYLAEPMTNRSEEERLIWYFEVAHLSFLETKEAIRELMTLNSDKMFQSASKLQARSNHAILPAVIMILFALLYAVLFNFYIHYYVVSPIIKMNLAVKDFIKKKTSYSVDIDTNDELLALSNSIRELCAAMDTEK